MNFIGHATVAGWEDEAPLFGVGAILPDLARMAGAVRAPEAHDDEVRRGVACHHRVDAVFHDTPTFVGLSGQLRQRLTEQGVSRPAALGTAHIGIELLLDGELVGRTEVARRWWGVVEATRELPASRLRWPDPEPAARYDALRHRLTELAAGYVDPRVVAGRVLAILDRRPRLRPAAGDGAAITAALVDFAPLVADRTDTWLDEIAEGLGRTK